MMRVPVTDMTGRPCPITQYTEVRKPFSAPSFEVEAGKIYVFLYDEVCQVVTFLCPCGCGSECYTPIVTPDRPRPADRPMWDFSRGPRGVTLTPSIRYIGGCKAHFNITDGRVIIHEDSGH